MSPTTLIYAVDAGIATITLNRPDKLNAFNRTMMDELIAAFDAVDADDNVRAVIVTGAGRGFCAGADLSAGGQTFDYEARGAVKPVISEHCRLEDLPAVHRRMERGGVSGRIVLRLDGAAQ